MDKNVFRKQVLIERKKIKEKDKKSLVIMNKIIDLDVYKKSKVIALYKSIDNEVITDYLINYSLQLKKVVLLPKVVGDKIVFFKYKMGDILIKSKFNILEPVFNELNIVNNIDLIIVPGVCFDKNNNRMGYGKGYYDRFLNNKKIYKIGICFDDVLYNAIPSDLFDVKMDLLITEKN